MDYSPLNTSAMAACYPFNIKAISKLLPEFPVEDACDEYLEAHYGPDHYGLQVQAENLWAKLGQHEDTGGPTTNRIDNDVPYINYSANINYRYEALENSRLDPAPWFTEVKRTKRISLEFAAPMRNAPLLMRLVGQRLCYQFNGSALSNCRIEIHSTKCTTHPRLISYLAGEGIKQTVHAFLEMVSLQDKIMQAAYSLWPFKVTPAMKQTRMDYIMQRYSAKLEYRIRKMLTLLGFPNATYSDFQTNLGKLSDIKPSKLYEAFSPHDRVQLIRSLDKLFLMKDVDEYDTPQRLVSYGAYDA